MTKRKTGTRQEWLAARVELLKAEKELTHRGDEPARRRQELPCTWPTTVAQNAAMAGTDAATYARERPGMSAFALEELDCHHATGRIS